MKTKLQNFIKKENLFTSEVKILVAVSGGADSIVLLDLLVESGYNCAVAHFNFQLRGQASEADKNFVKDLTKKYNLQFHLKEYSAEKYANDNKISIEMAARELRYNWFEEIRAKYNYHFIITAHHQDDSVETFLMNIARGTGIKGLTGIPLKNNFIVRPLMFTNKIQILEYCKKNNLQFRTDKTNFESVYARNKIRNKIIPIFKEINSGFQQNIYENTNRFKEISEIYFNDIQRNRYECIIQENENTFINIEKLKKLSPIKTYLFEFLRPYNFSSKVIDDIILSLNNISGKQFFSETHNLLKDRANLIITKRVAKINSKYLIRENQDSIFIRKDEIDELKLEIKILDNTDKFQINKDAKYAYFDISRIKFPLTLRKWEHGDYFFPFGMKKAKKLSDFFIDKKFSLNDKENTWLLLSQDKIIWIVGHRTDDRFRITKKTKKILISKLTINN